MTIPKFCPYEKTPFPFHRYRAGVQVAVSLTLAVASNKKTQNCQETGEEVESFNTVRTLFSPYFCGRQVESYGMTQHNYELPEKSI